MASFTVIGGPSTLERHKNRLQEYRIRQAYIDGAKHSDKRNGRLAMSNFMGPAPSVAGTSRIYTENVLKSYPKWVSEEAGRAFMAGQESGGNLYGSDLGWAAANYAESRLAARSAGIAKKKKEDDSIHGGEVKTISTTPGQDQTKAKDIPPQSLSPADNATAASKDTSTVESKRDKTDSKPQKSEDSYVLTKEMRDAIARDGLKPELRKDKKDLTQVSIDIPLDQFLSRNPRYAFNKAENQGFDKFAKTDLGISSDGAKIAHSVIQSSGISEGQALMLSSVIDNWGDDNFISSIPSAELSMAVSSLTAKIRSGSHTERDLKLLAALKKRVMKVTGDSEVSKAGSSVANALN